MSGVVVSRGESSKKVTSRKRKIDESAPIKVQASLVTRMTPAGIIDFVNSNLSEKQLSDIRDMGFDGLLNLKINKVPGNLAFWLVSNFNPFDSSLTLKNGKLHITDTDIHLATGIPMGPNILVQASKRDKSDEYLQAVNEWTRQFAGAPASITKNDILSKMKMQKEGGDDFKRNFIVYIVACFLVGVKGVKPSLRILKCLRDVSSISSFNWCYFTREAMIDSIMKWQQKFNKGVVKVFKGPIMVLILIYLDRVVFKLRKVTRVFPTLTTWTQEKATERICIEKKEAGGFGSGFVEDAFVKDDVSSKDGCRSSNENERVTPTDSDRVVEDEAKDEAVPANECIRTLVFAAGDFTRSFKKFTKALTVAKTVLPDCDAVCQMENLANGLMEGVVLSQETENEENDSERPDQSEPNKDSKDERPSVDVPLENDKFYCNDDLWAAADELIRVFKNQQAANQRCNQKKRKGPKDSSMPSFNIMGSLDDSQPSSDEPCKDEAPVQGVTTKSVLTAEKVSTDSVLTTENVPPDSVLTTEKVPPDSVCTTNKLSTDSSIPVISKRAVVATSVLKSPFLERNIDVTAGVTECEKEISNLAFLDGLDESEVMFRFSKFILRRCDLKSLMSEVKVSADVINVWGQILNKREEFKAATSPLRLYAVVTDKGISCDDVIDFAKLKLMFFPFAINHPILICVNFLISKIEVIHPLAPMSVAYNRYVQIVMEFIRSTMIPKSKAFQNVLNFTVEEFVPMSNIVDNDTGILLMRHMEVYKGNRRQFPTGITKQFRLPILSKLKVKYCHSILLSNLNSLKDEVTKHATALTVKLGKRVTFKESPSTNEKLLAYIFSESLDEEDVIIDTDWLQCTRKGLSSLSVGAWVAEMVIDMMGLYVATSRTDFLYIPTSSLYLHAKSDKIGTNYMKVDYMSVDGSNYKNVFIPINADSKHWYLCICDFVKCQNFILDSLPERRTTKRRNLAAKVVNYIANILSRMDGYKHFESMKSFSYINVSVPRQVDGFNCGAYVLKWLEAGGDDSTIWTRDDYYKDINNYRKEVAVKLLTWDKNKNKVSF